jgi:hypothetical protein
MTTDIERLHRTREREMDRVVDGKVGTLASSFRAGVVGVSFCPGYPDNLHALDVLGFEADTRGERLPAVLRRNPDNTYDANAIEVHIPSLGEQYGMIGHLPRPLAARLAPLLDADETWQAEVESVRIDPDHLDRPGIDIHIWKVADE